MTSFLSALWRGATRARAFVEVTVPAVLLVIMTVTVVVAVFTRYVLGHSVGGAYELAVLLFAWSVFLGASGALGRHMHVGLTVVVERLSRRPQAIAAIVSGVALIIACGWLIVLGWEFATSTRLMFQGLGVSMMWADLAVPVGAVLMLTHVCEDLVHAVTGLIRGDYERPTAVSVIGDDELAQPTAI